MPGGASRLDVLVVGAGPTGLTLGLTLAAWGVPTRVVDRQLDRVHESRALAIQPRSLEVLDALGLAAPLLSRGNDAIRVQFHAGGKVVEVPIFDTGLEDTRYPFVLFLSQAETEAVLSESLAERGLIVERGTELVDTTVQPDGLRCVLRHRDGRTEHVSPAYLVGCDGAHSTVRHQAGIGFAGSAYPQTFVLADVEVDGDLDPDAAHFFPGNDGVLLFFPLRHPASWRLLTIADLDPGRDPGVDLPTMAEVQEIVDRFAGGSLRLRDPFWLTYFKVHQRLATDYRAGPVFLAGDAAHVHSPAGGQGMNTGIQDAWNLGWKLALVLRGADPELLDSYQAERQPVGRFVLRLANAPFRVATGTSRVPRLVRTRLLPRLAPLAGRIGPVRRIGFRIVSELGIRYRGSPLSVERRPRLRTGPRAGDRVPDGPIGRGNQPSWLHEALSGPRLHLLLSGPIDAWDAAAVAAATAPARDLVAVHYLTDDPAPPADIRGDVLRDAEGGLLRRLGRGRPTQYLVRPDGHIGYRCAGTDLGGLTRYLDRWLPPRPAPPGA
jgi:2-polyprenyl-6-methoxyphenol hydroxylase-like FAD-dependent oxidoreductase